MKFCRRLDFFVSRQGHEFGQHALSASKIRLENRRDRIRCVFDEIHCCFISDKFVRLYVLSILACIPVVQNNIFLRINFFRINKIIQIHAF